MPLFDKQSLFRKAAPSGGPNLVWGWASVIEKDGQVVTDHDGDRISEAELVKAAHDFMENERAGGALHIYDPDTQDPLKAGEVVESVVFTHELQKALGIDLGKIGWLIGMRITDPAVSKAVADRTLRALSIGGRGVRTPIGEAD